MVATAVALKSPLFPLYKGGIFSSAPLTPLWKRGEGEIFGRNVAAIMQRTSVPPALGHIKEYFVARGIRVSIHKAVKVSHLHSEERAAQVPGFITGS
jgi:hypothetical protein